MDFYAWGMISFLVLVGTAVYVAWIRPRKREIQDLSSLQCFTAGLFAAVALMLMPVYCNWEVDENVWGSNGLLTLIRAVLLSIIGSIQVFLLGNDYTIIEGQVPVDGTDSAVLFRLYAACLFTLAPLLTFGNVLSMFSSILAEWRIRFCGTRRVYVLSEMNVESVTMAESISQKNKDQFFGKPLIVFADVFTQNEEENYELMLRAQKINALCIKKDVAHLKIGAKSQGIEIFLIGEDESENINQAIHLTEAYKNSAHKVSVFVYATSPKADLLLDNQDKGKRILSEDFKARIRREPKEVFDSNILDDASEKIYGDFSLRRMDTTSSLVMNVLTNRNYSDYEALYTAAKTDKTISVLILGMGSYGTQFFKTAVWFYQRFGYRVEFNIFDLEGDNGNAEKRIKQDCPELFDVYDPESGESCHDIQFFSDIDVFSSDFDDAFLSDKSEVRDRLKRTKLVFVSLGDDDQNIDAAIWVRTLFDRLHDEKKANADHPPIPYIYSVVYSDQKAFNLSIGQGLRNHKNQRYHIKFVGDFSSQYSYEHIENVKQREKEGFAYHFDWVRKESQLRIHYELAKAHEGDPQYAVYKKFLQEIDQEKANTDFAWNDGDYFKNDEGIVDYNGPVNSSKVETEASKYMEYAYFRQSSIAKLQHKEALSRFYPDTKDHLPICNCKICIEKRNTEHMRWNAYMRARGYKYDKKGFDRAKRHSDLCAWGSLPCRERYKD